MKLKKNCLQLYLKRKRNESLFLSLLVIILFVSPLLIVTSTLVNNEVAFINRNLKNSNGISYSGTYEGNISTLGLKRFEFYGNWTNNNSKSFEIPQKWPFITDFEYVLNRVDLRTYNIFKSTGNISIATNTTQGVLDDPNWFVIAQEFKTPDIPEETSIREMCLYLNFTDIIEAWRNYLASVIVIFDEDFRSQIGSTVQAIEPGSEGWFSFTKFSSNILLPNRTYYITYWIGAIFNDLEPLNFHTWGAENKTRTGGDDMGKTYIITDNNITRVDELEPIDMLCNLTYKELYKPEIIDLKYTIDNTEYVPNYQISIAPGSSGYEASIIYELDSIPQNLINISINTNTTVESLEIELKLYYIHRINASGTWQVINNMIHWNISYPYYYDIQATEEELWFLYETDWELDYFNNTIGSEIEMFSGAIKIYGEQFEGLFNLWGDPLGFGTCAATFHSPNYCSNVVLQMESGDGFQEKGYLQLGKTVKFEAEIRNSFNEPISGGIGNITLRDPSGDVLLEEGDLVPYNGILNSSEVYLGTDLSVGTYEVSVFWTNGREVAFYTMLVEVRHPEGYIPPETILLIALLVGTVIAIFPLSLTVRKYIRQRNWDKTLRDLFVLTKEGVAMYSYSFGIELQKPELVSGMISALTTFLKEATGSTKQLRSIDQEDKKVLLSHGQYTTIALMCDKDLPIIRKRLKKFSDAFESNYGKRLQNWGGEITIFKKADSILSKYFPVSTENKIIRGVREKLAVFKERIKTINNPTQVVSLLREITEFSSRYQEIINQYSFEEFSKLIKIAEEKIRNA